MPTGKAKLQKPGNGSRYDLRVNETVLTFKPKWFDNIPWESVRERKLGKEDLFALSFMDMIEGYVCAGYVHVALAPYTIRQSTKRTDFVISWGAQQNWHGISLHRFLDQYHGRSVSTRIDWQDKHRSTMSFAHKHSALIASITATVTPQTYTAVYACMGYRNELMTMHGYGSLLSRVNEGGVHPVLDPLLKNIMREEAIHARYYKQLATEVLIENPGLQKVARRAMNYWWGIVGEAYAGRAQADRIIRHLFKDTRGTELARLIDQGVGLLPGLTGVTPMKDRAAQAFSRKKLKKEPNPVNDLARGQNFSKS